MLIFQYPEKASYSTTREIDSPILGAVLASNVNKSHMDFLVQVQGEAISSLLKSNGYVFRSLSTGCLHLENTLYFYIYKSTELEDQDFYAVCTCM